MQAGTTSLKGASLGGLRREIERLVDADLGWLSFSSEAVERVRWLIPADACCFAGTEPTSLVQTDTALFGIRERAGAASEELAIRFAMNEYGCDDFAKNRELARSRRPVRVLEQETAGRPARSHRYREVLRPLGLEHELRAACVDRSGGWGFLHLFRTPATPGFSADEAAAIERIAPLLAAGMRQTAVVRSPPVGDHAPRMLALSERDAPVWQSPAAGRWLAEMRGPGWPETVLPDAILNTAAAARARVRAGGDGYVRVQIRTRAGTWWTVDATMLERPRQSDPRVAGSEESDVRAEVALLIQPTTGAALTDIIKRALGLTPREIEVTDLVLDGLATKAIAQRLLVSAYTVQDRLKVIFAKAGVHSRAELVALLNPALAVEE